MNILSKILLPVLIAMSLGLIVSTVSTYEMSMDTLKNTSTSVQKMAITNALVELKAGLDFNILNAISLSQTGILQPFLSEDAQMRRAYAPAANDRIINMRNTYYYVMLGIVDRHGRVLDHTEPSFIGQDFSNQGFYQRAMDGEVAVGIPYRYNDEVVYTVASPVYEESSEKIIGVVFNVSRLTDTMSERMLLGDKGYLFVADSTGRIFIHKDSEKVFRNSLLSFDWGSEILRRKTGRIIFDENGYEKLAYYDFLPEADWVVVAVRDVEEISEPGVEIRRNSIVLSIIMLVVLATIIFLYVESIIIALLKAVRYAEQISKGVLDNDLDLGGYQRGFFGRKVDKVKHALASFVGKKTEDEDAKIRDLKHFDRSDEIGDLYESLQAMVQHMRAMVQKADDSNRMKSEFLANMSHEIRTPLNAIIGLAHLCLTSDDDDAKKRDYVSKIEVAGKSLLGIINNVLDTSKIEAGMLDLEELRFSLKEVGERVLTIYQESANDKNLKLEFSMDPQMADFYIGDPVRLGQVLNNFVGNAIKFTESGSVSITCSPMPELDDAESIPKGTMPICIKVSDTGIGFSKEQEKLLFKPFAQADTSITRRFGGTGLGLVISKHLVELMEGKLLVESEVGKGTTFSIILFLETAEDKNLNADGSETENNGYLNLDLSGKRILVVEDNMINQLIMEELLTKTNADVTLADNGQIAVDMVGQNTYDIVLMDMQMPVMDGIQATEVIRKTFTSAQLPIIAITANAMKGDKERGIALGLNDYLTKPIDPPNLMMVLQQWLKK